MMKTKLTALLATAVLFAACQGLFAGPIGGSAEVLVNIVGEIDGDRQASPTISIPVEVGTGDFDFRRSDTDPNFEPAPGNPNSAIWDVTELSASGNIDPFVTLAFSVTNLAAVPATFTFSASLPTGPVGPATLFGGSVTGSLSDANGDGSATISPAPAGPATMYEGIYDASSVVLPLLGAPVSTSGIPFETVAVGPATAGLSPGGPTIPGPAVAASIEISQVFELTPGDSASFTATFVVEPVPEPASCVLLAVLALAGAALRRRMSIG